ncbi:MAG: LLM class flavin-dependent oxidoreductase, partial [Actinomycetota bacterium]
EGAHYRVDGVSLGIRPVQDPLEVWLGGMVPAALRRCGRIGEGWMPGLCTPEEAAEARATIETEAERAGRHVDDEHFGVNLSFVTEGIDDDVRAMIGARRTDRTAEELIAVGPDGLADRVEAFLDAGFSKFVIRPTLEPASWPKAVSAVAEVLELQS